MFVCLFYQLATMVTSSHECPSYTCPGAHCDDINQASTPVWDYNRHWDDNDTNLIAYLNIQSDMYMNNTCE